MSSESKSVLWTSDEVSHALGVAVGSDWRATGVSIDSRTIDEGDLFVAIVGPSHDGHRFVIDALENGAVAAVVHKDPSTLTDKPELAARMVVSEDTGYALQRLGAFSRERCSARIIAVTGSVGKTGAKEILRLVLSEQGRTVASQGNLNNHWGLPLSLARMPQDTQFGVFEMGMNHAGEIEPLSKIAKPDAAIITTVEMVHSEFFESVEDIGKAKAEIFAGLNDGGYVILNRDNKMFDLLQDIAHKLDHRKILTFGEYQDADFKLISVASTNTSCEIEASIHGQDISFELGIPGRHWALNALGALACVDAIGADYRQAANKLRDMHGLKGRGERHVVNIDGGSFVLIDESYNASPVSMRAALSVLGQSEVQGTGRRIAVLGDMLELGPQAEALHEDLIDPIRESGIDLVFTSGQYMNRLWDRLPQGLRGGHAMTSVKLSPLISAAIRPGDVISVKGSLGSKTRVIVDDLLSLPGTRGGAGPKAVNGN